MFSTSSLRFFSISIIALSFCILAGCSSSPIVLPFVPTNTLTLTTLQISTPNPTLNLISTNTSSNSATPAPDERDFTNYYGVWTITHFEHLSGSAFLTDEYAESQIGKKMQLAHEEMHFDNDFLWLSTYCANASYNWATDDEFVGHGWQALLPPQNLDKRNNLLFLDINCDGRGIAGFEVSKTGKLVAYYDGYWFFLDSEKSLTTHPTIPNITFTPTPSPKVPFTITVTLGPTEFYQEYFFDWLISKENDAHPNDVVQAGSQPLFTSVEHPDTSDSYIDLDSSIYTEGKYDLKLSFVQGNPNNYQLLAINGTKLIPVNFSNASLEVCSHTDYSFSQQFILLKTAQGSYFCAITSDQRFSLFHIDEVNHLGDGSLRLSFVTYKKDTDK